MTIITLIHPSSKRTVFSFLKHEVNRCEIPHQLERGSTDSEDAGPEREVDCEVPHRLEKGTSASEDVGP